MGWLSSIRHIHTLSAIGSEWHTHEDIQLMFSLRGEFEYEFKDAPNVILVSGQFLVIPPKVEHRHVNAIDPTGLRLEMRISGRILRGASFGMFPPRAGKTILGMLTGLSGAAHTCTLELSALITELSAFVGRSESGFSPIELATIRTLATLTLLKCLGACGRASPENAHSIVDKATAWLEEHLCENIGIGDLTQYMGLSRTWLQVLFKRQTGLSPADWIVRHRVQRAMNLLERSDARITDIAESCGFQSPQYFNSVFRRHTGFTPSEWRTRAIVM